MLLPFNLYLKQLPAIKTAIQSSVALYTSCVNSIHVHVAGLAEAFVKVRIILRLKCLASRLPNHWLVYPMHKMLHSLSDICRTLSTMHFVVRSKMT